MRPNWKEIRLYKKKTWTVKINFYCFLWIAAHDFQNTVFGVSAELVLFFRSEYF
jgi:hypothetical protein